VRINCAAIPRDLLESELFGYDKGAFTGAGAEGKPGKFELARHGTVFLDEVADLPIEMQPKLLRAIEDKEFERVGGTQIIQSDFRENRFRKDLFYRLNVIPLHIPPLRERKSDILPLAHYFLNQIANEATLSEIKLDRNAEAALKGYDWPGNVRELSNVLERAMSAIEGHTIHLCDLPFFLQGLRQNSTRSNQTSIKAVQARAEREAIRYALEENNYNKAQAAKLLGIHRTLLYKKMAKYKIALKPKSPL
jgi:transcriptional regulator with PAS, ATPase and Fis domain